MAMATTNIETKMRMTMTLVRVLVAAVVETVVRVVVAVGVSSSSSSCRCCFSSCWFGFCCCSVGGCGDATYALDSTTDVSLHFRVSWFLSSL